MIYRINTYDKKYIMINISDIAGLSDLEELPPKVFKMAYNIYLEWIKLSENNNNGETYEIALKRNNYFKKYLTTKEKRKSETDKHIFLYENDKITKLEIYPKVRKRKK